METGMSRALRCKATGSAHALYAAQEVGEELFLAGDDALEFPDVRHALGEIDLSQEGLGAAGEEEGVLGVNVGDQQGHEEEALVAHALVQGLDERGLLL